MKKVLCVLTDNFEEIEAIGTFALLSRGKVSVDLVALRKTNIIKGKYGLEILVKKNISEIKSSDYDSLFIAGGHEYVELESNQDFLNLILDFYKEDKIIGAICAAPTILGKLGILKNKNYTCFNAMNEDFGGTFIDHYCVVDKNLVTGKSAAATIEFALTYLEVLTSKENAESAKERIYYYNK
ncbi:MAG TPA: DJ-1 family protein [Firmicutes bacterium]|nr:DJ-1 family protein [Bacillota bacterium]